MQKIGFFTANLDKVSSFLSFVVVVPGSILSYLNFQVTHFLDFWGGAAPLQFLIRQKIKRFIFKLTAVKLLDCVIVLCLVSLRILKLF